jgi:hypothetical protein
MMHKCAYNKNMSPKYLANGKTRITIRFDDDILEWFRAQAAAMDGGNYQTLINQALREFMLNSEQPLEDLLRRVIREELTAQSPPPTYKSNSRLPR